MPGSDTATDKLNGRAVSLPARCVATVCFLGYLPWATGTFGSLAGLLLYALPGVEDPLILGLMVLAGFAVGVPSSAAVARAEGHQLTRSAASAKGLFQGSGHHVPDPSSVVIDEVVGMWIALLLLPKSLAAACAAFVLFRVLDILKPQPARALERLPGGWGIMLDDVVAGLYANLILQITLPALRALWPGLV